VQVLDQWLDQVELAVPGVAINVIVEASHGGKLIDPPHSVSGANRVIISSSSADRLAYAAQRGASFSDAFLTALTQSENFAAAFEQARHSAAQGPQDPQPWLDDNGDGIANSAADGKVAQGRRLIAYGTPICARQNTVCEGSAPQIVQVEMRPNIDQRPAITATVQDDTGVQSVWVVIYPPAYQPPNNSHELVQEPAPLSMQSRGDNRYSNLLDPLSEPGLYRFVFHAEDDDALLATPTVLFIRNGRSHFLPLVTR
jgi:hypothetical protein